MKLNLCVALLGASVLLAGVTAVRATDDWSEGRNYFVLRPAQPTGLPAGKIEVTEVFSYGCPACNKFVPVADKLRQSLPPNAELDYLPAAFNPAEDWPMLQRAFCAAQLLGLGQKTHDAMFDAVWKTGALATIDMTSGRIKSPAPTIEDAARVYHQLTGVSVQDFLDKANSFSVDMRMRQDNALIKTYAIDRTPTIIVNGKYRITTDSAGGTDKLVDLVKWLVAKESK
jgi:protein dithiol oxidoreductase (disulfide-forming)